MYILGIDPGSRNCGYAVIQMADTHTHLKGSLKLVKRGLLRLKSEVCNIKSWSLWRGLIWC